MKTARARIKTAQVNGKFVPVSTKTASQHGLWKVEVECVSLREMAARMTDEERAEIRRRKAERRAANKEREALRKEAERIVANRRKAADEAAYAAKFQEAYS